MITIILCSLLFIDLICIGRDAFSAATFLTILTLAGIWVFSHNPFLWIFDHLAIVGYSAIAYLILGFLYSMFKYKKFLAKKRRGFIGPEAGWNSFKLAHYSPPRMKGDILGWLFWWPLSIVGYFISDLVYDMLDKLWQSIKVTFENIFNEA